MFKQCRPPQSTIQCALARLCQERWRGKGQWGERHPRFLWQTKPGEGGAAATVTGIEKDAMAALRRLTFAPKQNTKSLMSSA